MNNMNKSVKSPACITLIICLLFILCSVTWADNLLTIPVSVEIVEEEAFAGSGVTIAVVTSGVKAIGNRAFADCSRLTDVVLPNHDIAIADDAFSGCGDVLFHTFSGSKNELWALSHGFRCESENPDILNQTSAMLTRFGIPSSSLQSDNRKYATCRLIVKMAGDRLPDISAYEPTEIIQAGRNRYFIQFDGPENTRLCCESLEADKSANGVLWVEPDAYFEAMEPVVSQQNVAAGWADSDPMNFDVYAAFVAEEGTGTVKIAVLDSGFPSNSVYASKLLTSKAKSFTLDGKGWRVDGFGHGRTVAAVIAKCTGNADVKILPVKVADSAGRVDTISMLLGLEYAAEQGVSFINLSIDYDDPNFRSEAIEDAICYCGATVVAAAGNFGSNRSCNSYFPARLNSVVSVGAVNPDYALSSYSCKDADYAAPGSVTVGGYTDTGTSFSAPQITAALALLRLDPYHGREEFDACCKAVTDTGKGMPQLEKLARKSVVRVRFENLPDQMLFDDFLVLEWSVLPRDATDTTVTCVSSDSSVIEVKANTSGMIQIIARKAGEAKLTIRSNSNPDAYDERQIRVIKRATGLTLQGPADGVVYLNQQVTLTPVFTPSDTSIRELLWENSNPSVLSVENGVVTPHTAGKATVTARTTDGSELEATISLTVQQRPPVEKITVMAENAPDFACAGETLQLTATVEPELALQEVTWESLFPDVASIDGETGLVSFKAEGTAVFIAESKDGTNVKGSFQIPVKTAVQIVFDPNGGACSVGSITAYSGQTIGDILPTPTRGGYTFAGWYTAANGGTQVTASTVFTNSSTVTVYAHWTANSYTVTFNGNGGTAGSASKTVKYDSTYGDLPTATRTGYTFAGWFTTASGGSQVTSGTTVTTAANHTLYAHWTGPNNYTVTFNGNGGTVSTASKTVTYDSTYGELPTPTLTYYTFDGWFTAANSDGGQVTSSTKVTTTSNHTLYAHWKYNGFGSWSDWSTTAVSGNDNREVQTEVRSVQTGTQTVYSYKRYLYYHKGNKVWNASYSSNWATNQGYTGYWCYHDTTTALSYDHMTDGRKVYIGPKEHDNKWWYDQTTKTEAVYSDVTYYRYRDRIK